MNKSILTVALLWASLTLMGQRTGTLLNDNWKFRFSHNYPQKEGMRVDLPHTWNTQDALAGESNYKRGIGNYERSLFVDSQLKGQRLFLRFEGVNSVSNLFINGKHVGEHRGGYTAFLYEITDRVKYGQENTLWMRVNNGEQLDVMPLVGDFNMYGGIYRDVWFITTNDLCISPLDHASPGVYLLQESVDKQKARVRATVLLSKQSAIERKATVEIRIKEGEKTIHQSSSTRVLKSNQNEDKVEIPIEINNPRLWNGRQDPFCYTVEVSLAIEGREVDRVIQPLGLRYFSVDPDKGFFLNGQHYPLQGVCRHQDRAQVGNALRKEHFDEDMALMLEMGVNAIRLAHYPYTSYMYELLDKSGVVAWSEIPFIGPGGYADKGFVDQPSFRENGKQQLRELIRQQFNHPSICFWGLFNELKQTGDNPCDYVRELNDLAHAEDPSRLTTAASNQDGEINTITDVIAWNRYDGWYGGMPEDLGKWLDKTHTENPQFRIAVSEYGAGASVYQQQDSLVKTVPTGWWHPENWQTYYYQRNWMELNRRSYVWGSFVWNMFDFGAAHRTEGDRPGINDKGLVSFDRRHRKDAYYFYKANWNKTEKTLYIAERRNIVRKRSTTTVQVFSNLKEVELWVNGKSFGQKSPDAYSIIEWNNVTLTAGENQIEVKGRDGKWEMSDQCKWQLMQ